MGVCGSKPKGCASVGLCMGKKDGKRRRRRRERTSAIHSSLSQKINVVDPSVPVDRSSCNPTLKVVTKENSDLTVAIESDCDEDFHSVQDAFGDIYQRGSDVDSTSDISSPRSSRHIAYDYTRKSLSGQQLNQIGESVADVERKCEGEAANNEKSSNLHPRDVDHHLKSDGSDSDSGTGVLHNCGLLPNTCLPCLAADVSSDDKKRPVSPGTPSTRRKSTFKFSFKLRDEQPTQTIFSPKELLQRPVAGSQVPCCPPEKIMSDCWSPIEPSTFKVRGVNYLRDKKKDSASNHAAYYPFGVDVFLSARKIDHIARFVELHQPVTSSGEVPAILVVNLQIPLYPAKIFPNEYDGEGMSYVLYFQLSENYSELPLNFQDQIRRLIGDEVERIRGFPLDTIAPFRERLKILGRVINIEDLHLSAAERKLMSAYNEKPVLSRPQHEFYLGPNYLEIDLDMHRFGYIPRKGFETFQDRLKNCILDFGLTIQGNKPEDLPENVLCCARLKEINYSNYHQLGC